MKTISLADLLAPFFTQHLRQHRNVSQHTVAAYRDTFRLLFRFFKKIDRRQPADLELGELTMERILVFLNHLERERNNTVRTRNARLAAIRCFVHYVQDLLGPDLPQPTRRILTIPPKRHTKPILGFLTRAELEAILNGCGNTWTGQRDHLLFLLLYNTGARISEVLGLRVRDVLTTGGRSLTLHGKGRKERTVPLWTTTQTRLRHWIKENDLRPESPLLPNRFGQPITRSGAAWQLRRLIRRAAERIPSLKQRRISPHTFRHTTAMHLLQEGVATEVIALWLGHESPNTTHSYIEADLNMKRHALDRLTSPKRKLKAKQQNDSVERFLDSL